MNYTINVNVKLELPECFDQKASEILKEHLEAQINQIVETYNVDNKLVEANVLNICHIDDNWFSPDDSEYDWR